MLAPRCVFLPTQALTLGKITPSEPGSSPITHKAAVSFYKFIHYHPFKTSESNEGVSIQDRFAF